jgi:hypothetical protein
MTRSQLADVYEALNDAIEFVGPYEDVVDGDYGAPEPNTAMRLLQKLNRALFYVDRTLEAGVANEARA